MVRLLDFENEPGVSLVFCVYFGMIALTAAREFWDWPGVRRLNSTFMHVMILQYSFAFGSGLARLYYFKSQEGLVMLKSYTMPLILVLFLHYCSLYMGLYDYPNFYHFFKWLLPYPHKTIAANIELFKEYERERALRFNAQLSPAPLPAAVVKKRKSAEKLYKQGDKYTTCLLCLGDFDTGDALVEIKCGHTYHEKCFLQCVMASGFRKCWTCNDPVFNYSGDLIE